MMLNTTAHRPWPPPRGPWVMAMQWHELAFLHWPLAPAALAPLLPAGLRLETFGGAAWLGVVPFMMRGVRARGLPPIPGTSDFAELNVRTYVTDGARPGVWFFSLDAASPLAVRGARWGFHLPYFDAAMACEPDGAGLAYRSARTHRGAPPAELVARYAPAGPVAPAAPGSLEHWLTERYCLYAADRRGRLWRGEIHHAPWPLQPAAVSIERCTLAGWLGVTLATPPALAHFARRIDVVAWAPRRVA